MGKIINLIKKNKIVISAIVGIVVVAIGVFVMLYLEKPEEVKLKMEVFKVEMNSELDKNAETYLENVLNIEAIVNFDEVDVTKVGKYEGTIKLVDSEYKIAFEVIDTEAPVLTSSQSKYTFALNEELEFINESINKNLVITDNSKEEFEPLKVIETLPESESEIVVKLSVKDKGGNVSNVLEITIEFTRATTNVNGNAGSTTNGANNTNPAPTPEQEQQDQGGQEQGGQDQGGQDQGGQEQGGQDQGGQEQGGQDQGGQEQGGQDQGGQEQGGQDQGGQEQGGQDQGGTEPEQPPTPAA